MVRTPSDTSGSSGCLVRRTIIADPDPLVSLTREEAPGPVPATFLWSSDVGRMFRVVDGIEPGIVHGDSTFVAEAKLPFGGFKNSGVGNAYGEDAFGCWRRTKRVTLQIAEGALPGPWPGA